MHLSRKLLLVLALIGPSAWAVEIDPLEVPLLKLTCPLDSNTEADGPQESIIFVLYKSGIGYSARNIWAGSGG